MRSNYQYWQEQEEREKLPSRPPSGVPTTPVPEEDENGMHVPEAERGDDDSANDATTSATATTTTPVIITKPSSTTTPASNTTAVSTTTPAANLQEADDTKIFT